MFTDKEIIRFRAICERAGREGGLFVYEPSSVLALLKRLETAELVVKAHSKLEAEKIDYDTFVGLLTDWRKFSGKA